MSSRSTRNTKKKLQQRQTSFDNRKLAEQKGFKRPGSLNRKKQA